MRILAVDDDPVAAAVLSKGLREHTYAVDVAANGLRALEQASISDYDLIVLDGATLSVLVGTHAN